MNDILAELPHPTATLDAVLIRRDGTRVDLGQISTGKRVDRPVGWWRSLWQRLRGARVIAMGLTFAAFLAIYAPEYLPVAGLVTTAGIGFAATDMAAGLATPRLSSMNFHDSGTGVTAAAIGDTSLQTAAGPTTRATGTQSNPSAGVYKSVGVISYTSTLAITEWGLFNNATQGTGTLWDHRVFSAVNVVSGESIQFSYSLTWTAGGS